MPKVLVTHPCKQYTHHLVYALQEAGYLSKFITAFWYKNGSFPFSLVEAVPGRLGHKLIDEFSKKSYPGILHDKVEQFPYVEAVREGVERFTSFGFKENFMYFRNRVHDYYASMRLDRYKPDIVIGYETSSKKTFRAARSRGIINILDLAQIHYKSLMGLSAIFPDLQGLHSDPQLLSKVNSYKQEELDLADYIIVLSDFAENTLTENGISKDKIFKISLGFDKETFKPKTRYRKSGIFKILFAGSITRRKGIHCLLESVRQLDLKDVELTMIGGISDGSDILEKYRGYYRHINFLNQTDLSEYYRDADIFVFPSLLDSWAMVVVEAMACGTPVIVSNNTGSKELVRDDINGFITDAGDVERLKDRILYFYNNRNMVESFGREAARSVENNNWNKYYREITGLIESVYTTRAQN